ncbi:hypothetical protein ACFLYF_02650 [Chloroflexota bacterium]
MSEEVESRTIQVPIAAKMAGIGRSLAYEMCRAGTFPGLLVFGSRYVISRKVFFEYLDGKSNGSANGAKPEERVK